MPSTSPRPLLVVASRILAASLALLVACGGTNSTGANANGGAGATGGEAQGGALANGEGTGPDASFESPDATASATAPDGAITGTAPDGGPSVLNLPPPGPRFPVVPMHLLPQPGASGADARVDLELRADGTIYSHGQLVGQLAGDRVLATDGREMLAVAPDGVVALQGRATAIRLNDAGEIVNPRGGVMRVGDDGAPLTQAGPGAAPTRGALLFGGFRPEARRTAALLALLVATSQLP